MRTTKWLAVLVGTAFLLSGCLPCLMEGTKEEQAVKMLRIYNSMPLSDGPGSMSGPVGAVPASKGDNPGLTPSNPGDPGQPEPAPNPPSNPAPEPGPPCPDPPGNDPPNNTDPPCNSPGHCSFGGNFAGDSGGKR